MTPEERTKLEALGDWLAVALGEKFGADVVFAAIWQEIQRRINAAVAEEREACLRLVEAADGAMPTGEEATGILSAIAAAIGARARHHDA